MCNFCKFWFKWLYEFNRYAFTLPIFKFFGSCQTACYVHYPTISTDMLQVVEKRADTFNNSTIIAKSKVLTQAKLIYYRQVLLVSMFHETDLRQLLPCCHGLNLWNGVWFSIVLSNLFLYVLIFLWVNFGTFWFFSCKNLFSSWIFLHC